MKKVELTPKSVSEILKINHGLCLSRVNRYFGSFKTRTDNKSKDGWTGSFFEKYSKKSNPKYFDGNDVSAAISLSIRGERDWVTSLLNESIDLSCFSGLPYEKCISDVPKDFFDKPSISQVIDDLLKINRIGLVVASKLIASKRPYLFPIFDGDVSEFFDFPMPNKTNKEKAISTYLEWCKNWQEVVSDPEIQTELISIRRDTSIKPNEQISSLRLLDVIFWFEGQPKEKQKLEL